MSATDDIRRMSNTLMVGHGGALLLIFNARIQNLPTEGKLLSEIAYIFAGGLAAAFLLYYMVYRQDAVGEQRIHSPNQFLDRMKENDSRERLMGFLFIGSCAAFVLGLLLGIGTLAPSPTPPPTAS